MNKPQWMSDPDIADIPQNKLDFLQLMVSQGNGLSPKEMLPFLMRVAKQGKENAISFSPEEMKRVVAAIKKNSTPEEAAKIEKIMKMKQKQDTGN